MAFADDFAQCLAQYNVQVDPSTLPDQDTLKQALDYAQSWLSALDPGMQQGYDAATTDDATSILLADPSVNAAPAIPSLLQAFDQAQGQPISSLMQIAQYCYSTAAQSSTTS